MIMRRLLTAILLLGACTMTAHAGLFVGASVGDSSVSEKDTGINFSGSDTGSKVYAGFTFFKFFGLEASYLDLGSPKDEISSGTDAKLDTTGWDAYAVGILPIGKHFELFAKAGIIVWDATASYEGAINGESKEDGNDPAYGAGLAIVFVKHFAVRAEYQRFDISDLDKVEMTSIGAEFRF
jgi:outer membrane protein with beta-barrel domain